MNKRIQFSLSIFDEVEFPMELGTRTIILRVTRFASIIIIGFDPTIAEVDDIKIGVIHASFFMKAIL
jgi:hypothetical protein